MTNTLNPWVLVVVADPSLTLAVPDGPDAGTSVEAPTTLLRRARQLTSISKTCCLIDEKFATPWSSVVRELWPVNVFAHTPGRAAVDGVIGCLTAIGDQEPDANVILVPFNHCIVQEENSWIGSAAAAAKLGAVNRNTVYLLHDKPDNDPRVALTTPAVCSSSVMVGAVTALLLLCMAKQRTTIVDLVVGEIDTANRARFTESAPSRDTPLNVVHVRLVEEYARLSRGDIWHRAPRAVDLRA